jgi:phage terminase large subunit
MEGVTMAKKVRIKPSFFNEVYIPYLFKTKRWNVFMGGRASAKTDFISSKNLLYLAQNPGKRMLVIVEYAASVQTGIMYDLKK